MLSVGACAQDVAPNTAKREYAMSDRTLGYSYAGGSFKPIANTPLGVMRATAGTTRPALPPAAPQKLAKLLSIPLASSAFRPRRSRTGAFGYRMNNA